jgi:hypothetical protein
MTAELLSQLSQISDHQWCYGAAVPASMHKEALRLDNRIGALWQVASCKLPYCIQLGWVLVRWESELSLAAAHYQLSERNIVEQ